MTNQEKKAFLSKYRTNELEIQRLQEEIERWQAKAQRITVMLGDARGGKGENNLQCCVEQMENAKERLAAKVADNIALRGKLEGAIESLPDDRLRLLMRYRYIDSLTLEQIAGQMNYSCRQICNLHGKALQLIKIA